MPFNYYRRLSPHNQRVYRRSDEITTVRLPRAAPLRPLMADLEEALAEENRRRATELSQRLADGITERLGVSPVRVSVLAVRPSHSWGELHGLYTAEDGRATVSLWMRTAKRRQVVAFRTFARTLLHELCHHLDFELYRLPESYHTEGFYKRESSLFRQLSTPEEETSPPPARDSG